jgi:hypothetical protein
MEQRAAAEREDRWLQRLPRPTRQAFTDHSMLLSLDRGKQRLGDWPEGQVGRLGQWPASSVEEGGYFIVLSERLRRTVAGCGKIAAIWHACCLFASESRILTNL